MVDALGGLADAAGDDGLRGAHRDARIATDIAGYLAAHESKDLLRFLTCGSVDDGKSTLIGRLLFDAHMIFDDQLAALEADSKRVGTQGENIDFALLVDGLASEREQGITIDVAYRFFSTARRKFIVADTPGHEQYTRNMATGASTADLAIILIDARKGVLTQTRRHSFIATLLGIRHIVLAVNKMDLVDYDQRRFSEIELEYRAFAKELRGDGDAESDLDIVAIPMSALAGDNITTRSERMPWYGGVPLMEHLETVEASRSGAAPFRLPVQWVNRPNLDFRGFAGRIAGGTVRPGDAVRALPSGKRSTVSRIVTMDGDLAEARAGDSVTLTLADEIDISRGDVLVPAADPPGIESQFDATVLWMADDPMLPGRPYVMKIGAQSVTASVTALKYAIDVNTLAHEAASVLPLNGIARCNISLDRRIPFDPYEVCAETGGFILIDRLTNATVGMGMINFSLRRSTNVHWQDMVVGRDGRVGIKPHRPAVLWFTGLSGSGKSTIANVLEAKLNDRGVHTTLLDGDNVRHGLNRDLGFTDADRVENIRRVAEVSRLMADAGLVTLVSFISPFRAERRLARETMREGEFIEIHVATPLEEAERRDVKGLYAKARAGEIRNFTGIDSPYEEPENAELRIDTVGTSPEEAADRIMGELARRGILGG